MNAGGEMKIDVARTAALAGLDLSDDEIKMLQPQLEKIVESIKNISKVDVSGVEPMEQAIDLCNSLRDDVEAPSMDREEALANAPARAGGEFLLPRIVE